MNANEYKQYKKGRKTRTSSDPETRRAEKRAACALRRARKEKEEWRRAA